ncbi:N-acetylmuramoyl-L-alanine amidase family protein [Sphingobacterium deserti]|uniref:N-acetylmuramoyl-L-alanine amidase n=1 Tax=Sphingobacterium deserti TaxID=1229276 RepID=A0A0B8T016_9SPHI|nr:N-acetylmuramoyl-L-alanine amidase [Sphingobacterium deserti]KGE13657.1 cell wall hydrolase/autolysin [Sphingobacterium deserti]
MTKNLNVKRLSLFVATIFTLTLATSATPPPQDNQQPQAPGQKLRTIVLDAGHGGHDAGARGRQSNEKDIALSVALKLGKKIEDELPGVQVVFTRKTDVFIPLYERPAVANKNKADLFISIHCNSADSDRRVKNSRGRYVTTTVRKPSVRGTETFVCGFNRLGSQDVAIRENASILLEENYKENYGGFDPKDPSSMIVFQLMKNQYRRESIKLASNMQDEFVRSSRVNRGVQELSLAVLATAGMPSVLTEIGFISSPDEEAYMLSSNGQSEIVANLFNAIKTYKTATER